jgi:hypothetical protein
VRFTVKTSLGRSVVSGYYSAISDDFIFQQDGAPSHTAKETVRYLERFRPSSDPRSGRPRPRTSNPVDFKIWSWMVERVFRVPIEDLPYMKARITSAWDELSQNVIDAAIGEVRPRLNRVIEHEGGPEAG